MRKILFATSECVPFVKTGGLADVCGALPKGFNKDEWDVRVVLPNYTCLLYTSSETKKPEGEQVWMNLEEFLLVKQRFLENTERETGV